MSAALCKHGNPLVECTDEMCCLIYERTPVIPAPAVGETTKSVVRRNAEEDPTYCPYCMRCTGLIRMKRVEPMYWRCFCGAEHDERVPASAPSASESKPDWEYTAIQQAGRIAELERAWTGILRETAKIATALGDHDEWHEADDSTLNAEFDPWDVLRKVESTVSTLQAQQEETQALIREYSAAFDSYWMPADGLSMPSNDPKAWRRLKNAEDALRSSLPERGT